MVITICHGAEEWDGMYLDGELLHEDHHERSWWWHTLFEDGPATVESLEVISDISNDYLENRGRYPKTLEQLKKDLNL